MSTAVSVIYDTEGEEHEVHFRDDVTVTLIQKMGGDESVVASAKVSTEGSESWAYWDEDPEAASGLINFLMRNRHGTPFEHNAFTFLVTAPIFVYREWHRHRVGWSYNEESGRYKELAPVFYVPNAERKLMAVPGTKTGDYILAPGDREQVSWLQEDMQQDYEYLYTKYLERLRRGYHKEVARMTLPVGIYSSMYATCNARSMMSFLSLRTEHETALKPSKPMREIAMAGDQMERLFAETFPITMAAFQAHGRMAP